MLHRDIDVAEVHRWIRELAELAESPEIAAQFEEVVARAQPRSKRAKKAKKRRQRS